MVCHSKFRYHWKMVNIQVVENLELFIVITKTHSFFWIKPHFSFYFFHPSHVVHLFTPLSCINLVSIMDVDYVCVLIFWRLSSRCLGQFHMMLQSKLYHIFCVSWSTIITIFDIDVFHSILCKLRFPPLKFYHFFELFLLALQSHIFYLFAFQSHSFMCSLIIKPEIT